MEIDKIELLIEYYKEENRQAIEHINELRDYIINNIKEIGLLEQELRNNKAEDLGFPKEPKVKRVGKVVDNYVDNLLSMGSPEDKE